MLYEVITTTKIAVWIAAPTGYDQTIKNCTFFDSGSSSTAVIGLAAAVTSNPNVDYCGFESGKMPAYATNSIVV